MYGNRKKFLKGFTLVELVVVATILAILGAVGFSAYTGYISGARDSNRIAQLASIYDGLNLFTAKASLPVPDESIDVEINGELIAYQGYAGANVLETIGYQKGGKDPKDDQYFSYYLDKKKNNFQLMAFLEEEENTTTAFNLLRGTRASSYTDRYPSLYGQELGILTDLENTPVHEIGALKSAGSVNITTSSTEYIGHMADDKKITGNDIIQIHPALNCKRIKDLNPNSKDGAFSINPDGTGSFRVICDMTTDGGGWTVISYSDDLPFQNHSETNADGWEWLTSDFLLELTDSQIDAIRLVSSEGKQKYVGTCSGVLHHYYHSSSNYSYSFGFRFHNNDTTTRAINYNAQTLYDIKVEQDGCAQNGGEGGSLDNATIFEIRDIGVPIINVNSNDNGSSSERFGSPLTDNPAYLR